MRENGKTTANIRTGVENLSKTFPVRQVLQGRIRVGNRYKMLAYIPRVKLLQLSPEKLERLHGFAGAAALA